MKKKYASIIPITMKLSSANAFNLDKANISLSGKGLKLHGSCTLTKSTSKNACLRKQSASYDLQKGNQFAIYNEYRLGPFPAIILIKKILLKYVVCSALAKSFAILNITNIVGNI